MNLYHSKTQKLANYHLVVYMYFRIQVKCTENTACSGNPITVTMTDQCPESENNDLDLSAKEFGSLASAGQAKALRGAGKINIQYQR